MLAKTKISLLEDFLYVFLFVFGLKIPVFKTTAILLFFFLPFRFLFCSTAYTYTIKLLKNKYIFKIMTLYVIYTLYSIFVTTIHFQLDFTLIPTLINTVLHLIVSVMLTSLFIVKGHTHLYIRNVIIIVFVIQSCIEIFAFFSPTILSFVQNFQDQGTVELADTFHGRRGLALSGTVFFGLSSIFGLIYIIFIQNIIDNHIKRFDILVLILLIIGGFFTGRTFFVGLGVAFFYFLFSSVSSKKKFSYLIKFCIVILLSIIILFLCIPAELYTQIDNLLWYVFEAFINFSDSGRLESTSTDKLFGEMYFNIPLKTLFLGDGCYMGLSGGYYMNTDAGYMRNILFSGLLGLLFPIIIDCCLLFGNKKLKCIHFFSSFILIYMFILHIKGETFGYLITFHCILFLYYFSFVFCKPNETRHINLYI